MHAPVAFGQAAVMRVEEEWYIQCRTPVAAHEGPQITTVISPQANLNGHYAVFCINYGDLPTFTAGKLQLQIWQGNTNLILLDHPVTNTMATAGEVIRFNTRIQVTAAGNLEFEVKNGRSTTWGSFGAGGQLSASVPTQLTDLSGYSPATTVAVSGMSRSAHNMELVNLKAVRYFDATGLLIFNDRTVRSVFAHTDYAGFLTYSQYLATPYQADPNAIVSP